MINDDSAKRHTDTPEESVWIGGPSQLINIKAYLVCGALFVAAAACLILLPMKLSEENARYEKFSIYGCSAILLILALIAFWNWLEIRCLRFELTTQRLLKKIGVFARRTDVLEIYRVKDISMTESIFERMFGLGTIVLNTSDQTTPIVKLQSIKDPRDLVDKIRHNVERRRVEKGVRELDVE
ncbi:MAG: Bacterial membrane flanked domain protein [candidate division BRC1 bacterium ADurb.BinA364]|nr:MAG: Bacterial membrane flanked domain protein [candidate division BRC1 bacterium ADurb.BinA364]